MESQNPESPQDKAMTQMPSSGESELHELLKQRRAETEQVHSGIRDDVAHRRRLAELSSQMAPLSPEQLAQREQEEAKREAEREFYARDDRWRAFIRERGNRYAESRIGNFIAPDASGERAVARLTEYCETIVERTAAGEGLLLFGPKGTGKDHLVVAVARVGIYRGLHLVWQNGMDLFGDIRDAMDSGAAERSIVQRLVAPGVLYLSDPVPPVGKLTEFQATMIFRVLDGRYSRRRPTWCTINVANGQELDERLGAQNGDRLRDSAWAVACNWPSFRKAIQ